MHAKYFFINQEKWFGLIVIICIVMSFVLLCFFLYHVNLAWKNETTNENFKRKNCDCNIKRELSIVRALIQETDEWQPKSTNKED